MSTQSVTCFFFVCLFFCHAPVLVYSFAFVSQDGPGASEGAVLRLVWAPRRRATSCRRRTVAPEEREEETPRGRPESSGFRAPPGRDRRVGCVRDALGAARAAGTVVAVMYL